MQVPTTPDGQERGLLSYLAVLWSRRWTILLATAVAAAAAFGVDQLRTRTYDSTASIVFLPQSSSANVVAAVQATQLATDVQLLQSEPVQGAVTKALGTPAPPASVALVQGTQVADVTVSSTDASFAARAANAYVQMYLEVARQQFVSGQLQAEHAVQAQINSLNQQINTVNGQLGNDKSATAQGALNGQLNSLYGQLSALQSQLAQLQLATSQYANAGQQVGFAAPSHTPASPKVIRDTLIGAGVGLILGIGVALLLEFLDDRIRNKADLEAATPQVPNLGLIPIVGDWRNRRSTLLAARDRPTSPAAEAYRGLRTAVQFMSLDRPIKLLQITSPAAADGKTTTAVNLAYTIAQAGQSVVLVDCDLRRPRLHEFFSIANTTGFTSVLMGQIDLRDALVTPLGNTRLAVLPSGPIPPNPSELLSTQQAVTTLGALSEIADVVVLDSTPLLPVTDATVLAARVDGVLLVTSAGVSSSRETKRAVEMLRQVGAPLVGTILNRAPTGDSYVYSRYGYGYGYGYGNGNGGRSTEEKNGNGREPAPPQRNNRRRIRR